MDMHVDLMLSSPLKRATQTAALVGNEIAYEQKIELTPALQPGASYESFRQLLHRISGVESMMVVGHNPNDEPVSLAAGDRGAERVGDRDEKRQRGARWTWTPSAACSNWLITPRLVKSAYTSAQVSSRPKTSEK